MRHFIIETRLDTGRKYFRGLSVTARYAAERDLAKRTVTPGRTLAIESFPTVEAATAAIAAHNQPLPLVVPRAVALPVRPSLEGEDGRFYPLEG